MSLLFKKFVLLIILLIPFFWVYNYEVPVSEASKSEANKKNASYSSDSYWFALHRESGNEFLYLGTPGVENDSSIVREFQVKTGADWSPTPLPELVGREYWLIVSKVSSEENPDTAPYFLQLDVPVEDEWPYGPVPYTECKDVTTGEPIQCDWVLPGYFGLHGTGGDPDKLSVKDLGSSGCIRHDDNDITYLYNLLDPENEEIRYYVFDNS